MNKRVPVKSCVISLLFLGWFLVSEWTDKNEPHRPQITPAAPAANPAAAPFADHAPAPFAVSKPDLELLGHCKGAQDTYTVTITGRIRNNSGRTYDYAEVTFNLYNRADEQIGTALANVTDLEPGKVWKFKASGFASEGVWFKLSRISGH